MVINFGNRKAKSSDYSDGIECFSLESTDDNNVMILSARTGIRYFNLKRGSSIT
jgi:hypothetical protein